MPAALLLLLAPSALLLGSRPPTFSAVRMPHMVALADGEPMTGTCKWFNVEKGYGFIAVDESETDIFVHQSDIYAPGFRSLAEGEALEFRVQTDSKTGKLKAVEVTGPDGAYVQGAPKQERDDYY
ncbi:hypothetical protein AB1Y20_012360 [Prymnesium parvum]